MPLSEASKSYIGQKLLVVPYYGHGWGRQDTNAHHREPNQSIGPAPFHVLVDEFIYCAGQAMGASGTISELGHEFDRYWCGFFLRPTTEHDFTAHPGDYMVWICAVKPQVVALPERALFEWVSFDKSSLALCGFGMVAENEKCMGKTYELAMATRRKRVGE
ncbi:MAG TPA: hypothetical protein VN673_09705 [Clostridia bacterium]|nr:hypothetical protein [Clostridia bacterium]